MDSSSLVSVIVPVYKVEQYLQRCVDSILCQTYHNLEIILVDDGSPDGCPALCEQIASNDSRFKVVHKKNGGLSSARNAGYYVATGEYVLYVDSDDWIEPDTVQRCVDTIVEQNVDFVSFSAVYENRPGVPDGTPVYVEPSRYLAPGRYDRNKIRAQLFERIVVTNDLFFGPILSACMVFFSMSFLKRNNLVFDEKIMLSEDSIFGAEAVYAADSIYCMDKAYFYHYFFNSASLSKAFLGDALKIAIVRQNAFEKVFADKPDYDFKPALRRYALFGVLDALSQRRRLPVEEREAYVRSIVNDPFAVAAYKYTGEAKVGFKKKVLLLLIRFRLVKLLLKIFP